MDRQDLDPRLHRAALAGLARVNRLSRAGAYVWRQVEPVADSGIAVLDLACGGGDVTLDLWRRAQQAGCDLDVEGLDLSPVAVQAARERAEARSAPVRFRVADVLAGPLPGDPEVIVCSLFLHHLTADQAVDLLRRADAAARRRVVIEDLRRCRWGSLLAATVPRLLSRSPVVHIDARRSARAAFTAAELDDLTRRAGVGRARIRRHWPARLIVSWDTCR